MRREEKCKFIIVVSVVVLHEGGIHRKQSIPSCHIDGGNRTWITVLTSEMPIPFLFKPQAVLQIRRGKRDNLGIIFHTTYLKHIATHH